MSSGEIYPWKNSISWKIVWIILIFPLFLIFFRDDIEEAFDEEDEFEDENKPKSVIVRTAISENNGGKIQKRKHEDNEEDNQDVEQSTQNPPRDKRSRRQESSNSDSESSKEMTKDEGEDEK